MESFDGVAIAHHPWIGEMAREALANEGQTFMNALIRIVSDPASEEVDRAIAQAGLRTLGGIMSRAGIPNEYGMSQLPMGMGSDQNPTPFLIGMLIASDEWPAGVDFAVVKAAFLDGSATGVMRAIIRNHLYAKAGIDSLTPPAQAMLPVSSK